MSHATLRVRMIHASSKLTAKNSSQPVLNGEMHNLISALFLDMPRLVEQPTVANRPKLATRLTSKRDLYSLIKAFGLIGSIATTIQPAFLHIAELPFMVRVEVRPDTALTHTHLHRALSKVPTLDQLASKSLLDGIRVHTRTSLWRLNLRTFPDSNVSVALCYPSRAERREKVSLFVEGKTVVLAQVLLEDPILIWHRAGEAGGVLVHGKERALRGRGLEDLWAHCELSSEPEPGLLKTGRLTVFVEGLVDAEACFGAAHMVWIAFPSFELGVIHLEVWQVDLEPLPWRRGRMVAVWSVYPHAFRSGFLIVSLWPSELYHSAGVAPGVIVIGRIQVTTHLTYLTRQECIGVRRRWMCDRDCCDAQCICTACSDYDILGLLVVAFFEVGSVDFFHTAMAYLVFAVFIPVVSQSVL
jgi:hypothetical protein